LLVQLKDILKEKCCRKITKGALFLHNSAVTHQALATQKKLAYLSFQCLDHPHCSLDLAMLDYHLFPGLKRRLNGRLFLSNMEIIAAMDTWLDGQPSEFFEWLAKVRGTFRGEYVQYIPSLVAVSCFLPGRAKGLPSPLVCHSDSKEYLGKLDMSVVQYIF
jgi:hypothetical protein